jgi:hypothetical protein
MSQVLRYGFPSGQRILCDNPACERPADQIATVDNGLDPAKQISGCNDHIAQLITGQKIVKLTPLAVPGQYNKTRPAEKTPVERRRAE